MCKLSPFHSKALKFGCNHNKHSDFIHIKVLKGHLKGQIWWHRLESYHISPSSNIFEPNSIYY